MVKRRVKTPYYGIWPYLLGSRQNSPILSIIRDLQGKRSNILNLN